MNWGLGRASELMGSLDYVARSSQKNQGEKGGCGGQYRNRAQEGELSLECGMGDQ